MRRRQGGLGCQRVRKKNERWTEREITKGKNRERGDRRGEDEMTVKGEVQYRGGRAESQG